jgi:hypothetical protein
MRGASYLYSSLDIIRKIKVSKMRWTKHVEPLKEMRNTYTILGRKPEGKRQLRKYRHRFREDSVMVDFK